MPILDKAMIMHGSVATYSYLGATKIALTRTMQQRIKNPFPQPALIPGIYVLPSPGCRSIISQKERARVMWYALIRHAILERKIVRAVYQGLYCEVCPHLIGKRDNKYCVLCYQFGGRSRSGLIQPDGSIENWRCIDLDELSDVTIEDGTWHTAPYDTSLLECIDDLDVAVLR